MVDESEGDDGSDDTPPKSIAESAGLDDDERVVGDIDGARTVTGDSGNDSILKPRKSRRPTTSKPLK